jgi:hypothetical protein
MLTALLVATHLTMACPDLSGRFTLPGEDGHVAIRIEQVKCDSLIIDWLIYSYPDTSPGTYVVHVDGRARREKQWFHGRDSTWITATWRGDYLEIVSEGSPRNQRGDHWEMSFRLTARNNLCIGMSGNDVRGRLAQRVGREAEPTDDAFTCMARQLDGTKRRIHSR